MDETGKKIQIGPGFFYVEISRAMGFDFLILYFTYDVLRNVYLLPIYI